ncbi:hypothetical protein TWF569_003134 [Orbilia oligospora]|uniref:Uncharacterized protein n=1 Tax=Orbilia oligospora TaxID=2813651 RepID=A0A7C8N4U2_ORBOL|nr:hypothetical protein TWF102_001005 [Orbilia oligospora]KAF3087359.1 hypothetical protein TWF706_011217 [Orbilia oligospora]KAF3110310.1 hypothetical protein TWF103_004603 [Orbilia oligospora]KAF3120522.1 hypothetical protein TWF569_003134 [Orbilia oligospora]KAF3132390.1 hypothetical protein TWF594_009519 [Orbilia oligospora]
MHPVLGIPPHKKNRFQRLLVRRIEAKGAPNHKAKTFMQGGKLVESLILQPTNFNDLLFVLSLSVRGIIRKGSSRQFFKFLSAMSQSLEPNVSPARVSQLF